MANYYYRSSITDFAKISEPIVAPTRKHARFHWTQEHQQAFDLLKEELARDTVMTHPRTDQPYLLHCHTSDYAVCSIPCILDDLGIEHAIVYHSKRLLLIKWHSATSRKRHTVLSRPSSSIDRKTLTSLFTKGLNNTMIHW